MGDIPTARYRERVIGESHEATEAGDSKDPLHPLPSVHVAEERVLSSPVPDHSPCLMPPGFGPLEGALVAFLIFLASITQLLDAS